MPRETEPKIAQRWVEAAIAKDAARVSAILAENVVAAPPFLEKPVTGREEVMNVFGMFAIATRDFEYGRIWTEGHTSILEFRATVAGRPLHGLDLIEVDEDGKICRFDIFARPLPAIAALAEAAQAQLRDPADPS